MATAAVKPRRSDGQARAELRERLTARREEIEQALLTRTYAIADPAEVADPAYAESLRRAVSAALEYGLEALDAGESQEPAIPVELLAQTRLAARVGIPLDTVLRRYFAGYSLLGFYLMEEASRDGLLDAAELRHFTAAQAGHFDRLLAVVGEEYEREERARRETPARRETERIERLLAGEPVDTSEIAYDFDGWHVGVAASGPGAEHAIAELGAALDCRRLTARREEGTTWAWLGTRRRLDPADVLRHAPDDLGEAALAVGEPAEGMVGWQFTHRQAVSALPLAERGPKPAVRYRDVALLAAVHGSDVLHSSLRRLYLEPLKHEPGDGVPAKETLRAYFEADRNVSSAASALGVTRKTVNARLRAIERRIACPLTACSAELEISLRLDQIHSSPVPQRVIRPGCPPHIG